MLGRPPTASEVTPLPLDRISEKVQVEPFGARLHALPNVECSVARDGQRQSSDCFTTSGFASLRQTTEGSTASTFTSFERDASGGHEPAEILLRLSQVGKKLEEMTDLMHSCLDGIESVKQARPGSADGDGENGPGSAESSRPATAGLAEDQVDIGGQENIIKLPTRAWDDKAPKLMLTLPESPRSAQPSHLGDDAWAQPAPPAPVHIPSSGFEWRNIKASIGDILSRTLNGQGSHERPEPPGDDDSTLSPTTRRRRASLVLMEKALTMFQGRSRRADAVWQFLEESDSGRGAKLWNRVWCMFVFATVLLTVSQTLGPRAPMSGGTVVVLETIVEAAFLLELLTRLVTCPDMKHFLTSVFNVIDMASALPLALRISSGFSPIDGIDVASDPVQFLLLCVVPVVRLLKILRREQLQLQLFEAVVDSVTESLQFLGFVGMCIVLAAAALIFLVEPRDNIESYAHACWLATITMSTVGYGDVFPVTDAGRLIISVLTVTSSLYMALPIGVMGNAFSAVWKDRDLILLIDKTRRRLSQWGYTALDVPTFFQRFDFDGDGELDLSEFRVMMKELRVNLKEERLVELFEVFDTDRGGSVDDKEFLHVVFPRAWHDMVQKEKEEEEAKEAREKEERERKERERKERRKRRASGDSLGLSPRPSPRPSPRHSEDNLVHNLVEGDCATITATPGSLAPKPAPIFPSRTAVAAPRTLCPTTTLALDKGSMQPPNFLAFSGKEPTQKF